MKQVTFTSCLADAMGNFFALRQLSGTDYRSQALLLARFDRFLAGEGFVGACPDAGAGQRYLATAVGLAPRPRANLLCVLRQFCLELAMAASQCCVPEPERGICSADAHVPHIYSDAEIRAILKGALGLGPPGSIRPQTFHTLFGLLWSSGLRIGEAMALDLRDACADSMRLHIRNGKFRKARWVPLSESTGDVLRNYINLRCGMFPPTDRSALFVNVRGDRLRHSSVYVAFHDVLAAARIPKTATNGPRIHDFRHTFAVRRVLLWYAQDLDVNALLPSLATYMGHVGITSTQVYLNGAAALLGPVGERFHDHFAKNIHGRA